MKFGVTGIWKNDASNIVECYFLKHERTKALNTVWWSMSGRYTGLGCDYINLTKQTQTGD